MAIDDEHPEYTERKIQWEKLRDCAAGQEAIHAKGKQYLPRLSGQTNDEYRSYVMRSEFYGATGRTIDGLSGMVFRKSPQYEVPAGFEPYLDDVTLDGTNLLGFAEQVIDDGITVGRCGILVDHPVIAAGTTVAQAEASNIRPFLKMYTAEQIFNWKTEGLNNQQVVTQVRLWEWEEVPGNDEFEAECRRQIRVLDLNEVGQYRQRVFVKMKIPGGIEKWIQIGPDIIPLKKGAPLTEVPFFFVGVKNGQAKTEKPPLIDLANINLSHYLSTADIEHGAHFTALPTAVITGHQEADEERAEEYRIGAATAWVFPNHETKVEYLEFKGQGLEALEKRLAKKEEYMAFLGARMLAPDKKGVESSETAQIHRMGEISVLSSLAASASESIKRALMFMADWSGFDPTNITFYLNSDFITIQMDAPKLLALLQLWQGRGIAFADLLDNLKKGDIVRDDRTEEEIKSETETENPFSAQDMPPAPLPVNA